MSNERYENSPEPDEAIVGWSCGDVISCPWCLGIGDDPIHGYDEAADAGQIVVSDFASGERPIDEKCDRCGRWLMAPFALRMLASAPVSR